MVIDGKSEKKNGTLSIHVLIVNNSFPLKRYVSDSTQHKIILQYLVSHELFLQCTYPNIIQKNGATDQLNTFPDTAVNVN